MTRVHVIPTPNTVWSPGALNTMTNPPLHRLQTLQSAYVLLVLAEPSSFVAGYQQSCHCGSYQLSYSRLE